MTDLRKECPMRHENGNCTVIGGFCTAVNDPICQGLHNAWGCGYRASALRAQQERENPKPLSYFLEPKDSYKGLKRKYIVFKSDTGEMVENCFVLRPDKDPAAVAALRAYAGVSENETLSADIINWVGADPNDPLTLDELRQMDGEPVWVIFDKGFESLALWALVNVCDESISLTNNLGGRAEYAADVELEDDGITVYRRKLEEG